MIFSEGKVKLLFGSNMAKEEIKSNSTYQKEIEKSFAIIYYNLKRIQDTTPVTRIRKHSQLEMPDLKSSQQSGSNPNGEKSYSVAQTSKKTNRRVSFAANGVSQFYHGEPTST